MRLGALQIMNRDPTCRALNFENRAFRLPGTNGVKWIVISIVRGDKVAYYRNKISGATLFFSPAYNIELREASRASWYRSRLCHWDCRVKKIRVTGRHMNFWPDPILAFSNIHKFINALAWANEFIGNGPRPRCARDFVRFNSNEYLPLFFVYVFFSPPPQEKKYEKLIKTGT